MCISTARLIRYIVFVASDMKKLSGGQNKHNTKVTEQVANKGFFLTKEKGIDSSYPYTSYPKVNYILCILKDKGFEIKCT